MSKSINGTGPPSRTPQERRVVCAPASLKGVLSAIEAARALAAGVRDAGAEAVELPIADGGEGTMEVLHSVLGGQWREAAAEDPLGRPTRARWLLLPDGTAIVESAEAVGLGRVAEDERDPLRATSRGLGLLLQAVLDARPERLLVTLGGSATVEGGAEMRRLVGAIPTPVRVACDVRNPLLGPRGAARAFGPQKGASPEGVEELERRLAADAALAPHAGREGAGAAGGLGAAFAALGGTLVAGAELVLEAVRFAEKVAGSEAVVTGEGTVDATTAEGKAPAAAARAAIAAGVRCVVFGGRVVQPLPGVETVALSGSPSHAAEDLTALGYLLASRAD